MRSQNFAALAGRILLALIFLWSGVDKVVHFSGALGYVANAGLPFPDVLLALSIVLELGGGLALMLGWKARWAAMLIFLYLIPVTAIFHNPIGAGAHAQEQLIHLMKNLSIMGGMLTLVAFGPGAWSIERRLARADSTSTSRLDQ
jgi:putative oxidoreductase